MTQLRVPIWFYPVKERWYLLLDVGTELPTTKELYLTTAEDQQETLFALIGTGMRGCVIPSLGVTIGSLPPEARGSARIRFVYSINTQRSGTVQAFTDTTIALPVALDQYRQERLGDRFYLDNPLIC